MKTIHQNFWDESKRNVHRNEGQHQHTRRFQPTDNLHDLETQEVKSQATECEETKNISREKSITWKSNTKSQ